MSLNSSLLVASRSCITNYGTMTELCPIFTFLSLNARSSWHSNTVEQVQIPQVVALFKLSRMTVSPVFGQASTLSHSPILQSERELLMQWLHGVYTAGSQAIHAAFPQSVPCWTNLASSLIQYQWCNSLWQYESGKMGKLRPKAAPACTQCTSRSPVLNQL